MFVYVCLSIYTRKTINFCNLQCNVWTIMNLIKFFQNVTKLSVCLPSFKFLTKHLFLSSFKQHLFLKLFSSMFTSSWSVNDRGTWKNCVTLQKGSYSGQKVYTLFLLKDKFQYIWNSKLNWKLIKLIVYSWK